MMIPVVENERDVFEWLYMMGKSGMTFHLDDDATDIWDGELGDWVENRRRAVWEVCNPWHVVAKFQVLSRMWEK